MKYLYRRRPFGFYQRNERVHQVPEPFYSGLIPPAIHERIKAPMMEEETRSDADEESGGFNYERAAYIILPLPV